MVEVYYNESVLPLMTRCVEHLLRVGYIFEGSTKREIEACLLTFLKAVSSNTEEHVNVPGLDKKENKGNKVLLEKIDGVLRTLTKRILNEKPEDVKGFMMNQLE